MTETFFYAIETVNLAHEMSPVEVQHSTGIAPHIHLRVTEDIVSMRGIAPCDLDQQQGTRFIDKHPFPLDAYPRVNGADFHLAIRKTNRTTKMKTIRGIAGLNVSNRFSNTIKELDCMHGSDWIRPKPNCQDPVSLGLASCIMCLSLEKDRNSNCRLHSQYSKTNADGNSPISSSCTAGRPTNSRLREQKKKHHLIKPQAI